MSRRKRRPAAAAGSAARREEARPGEPRSGAAASGPHSGAAASGRPAMDARPPSSELRPSRRLTIDLAILTALVGATVGIAELAGAANLGVALGIAQVVFAVALVALLLRA